MERFTYESKIKTKIKHDEDLEKPPMNVEIEVPKIETQVTSNNDATPGVKELPGATVEVSDTSMLMIQGGSAS